MILLMERERHSPDDDEDVVVTSDRRIAAIREDLARVMTSLDRLERESAADPPDASASVFALALETLGSKVKAEAWMARPNATLDGRAPADVAQDPDGARRVRLLLERISHGVFG